MCRINIFTIHATPFPQSAILTGNKLGLTSAIADMITQSENMANVSPDGSFSLSPLNLYTLRSRDKVIWHQHKLVKPDSFIPSMFIGTSDANHFRTTSSSLDCKEVVAGPADGISCVICFLAQLPADHGEIW